MVVSERGSRERSGVRKWRTLYDHAAQILQARSQYREMNALTDPGEKQRKRADLRALFPAADDWYEYQKAASRGARGCQSSRGA